MARKIEIGDMITIGALAEKLSLPATRLISVLFKNGMMVTINEKIDVDTAQILVGELGLEDIEIVSKQEETNEKETVIAEMSLTTILAHSSGEWISQQMSLPMSKVDAQGAGSALTYMRRYALAAAVGVVQADDDANAAVVSKSSPAMKTIAKDIL